MPANKFCKRVKYSEKIHAPNIVAVIGCIKRPIDPKESLILGIPKVIKLWPRNWLMAPKQTR